MRSILALCLLAAAFSAAAGEDADRNYAAKCASCHGKDGKGNPAMANIFKLELPALDLTDAGTLGKKDAELTEHIRSLK